ncbi:MAG: methylmalonyl-CoA mutase family protein [Phycisphaerales bacterium]
MANGQSAKESKKAGVYAPKTTYGRGVVAGINRGYFRRQIAEASYRFSEECEASDRIIVGVNAYSDPDEKRPIDILVIPHTVEVQQNERLAAFKKRRDKGQVEQALANIRAACQGKAYTPVAGGTGISPASSKMHATNVMPALVDGALANCTLGEMVQAMADIYGRYSGGPEW